MTSWRDAVRQPKTIDIPGHFRTLQRYPWFFQTAWANEIGVLELIGRYPSSAGMGGTHFVSKWDDALSEGNTLSTVEGRLTMIEAHVAMEELRPFAWEDQAGFPNPVIFDGLTARTPKTIIPSDNSMFAEGARSLGRILPDAAWQQLGYKRAPCRAWVADIQVRDAGFELYVTVFAEFHRKIWRRETLLTGPEAQMFLEWGSDEGI